MPSAALVTIATRHQSHYERLKSAEVAKFDKFLKKLDRDVRAQLGAVDITEFSRTRLEKQLTQIKVLLGGTMADYAKVWHDSIEDAALYEADLKRLLMALNSRCRATSKSRQRCLILPWVISAVRTADHC